VRRRSPAGSWQLAADLIADIGQLEQRITAVEEALRCLKRRLSDAVYRCLVADQRLAVAAG
jgi:hypothetical protein